MEWEAYLAAKKIDAATFRSADPIRFEEFRSIFMQMHPESFTAQKLFLINQIRRSFPLEAPSAEPAVAARPGRPIIKPKK